MEYTHTQQMLTLSYLSYLGFELDKNSHRNAVAIHPLIKHGLETWKPLADQWELAWGPVVYKFPFALFDDNLMYVVKHKQLEDTYAIAIRGTNPIALSDWVLEDLLVQKLVPWPSARDEGKLKPKISYSTYLGLHVLQNMTVGKSLPSAGEDLKTFLRNVISNKTSDNVNITVTGHSLAGALAPLLALWLRDTQGSIDSGTHDQWDQNNSANISTVAFAGPSPGNKDFSKYYDKQLGESTDRIHNELDVVPHAWSRSTMKGLLSLYKGTASPTIVLRAAYYYFRWATRHQKYEQIKPKAPAFAGTINPDRRSFELQMIEQHVLGYLDEYNLRECIELNLLEEAEWAARNKLENPFDRLVFSS